jgi:2,4-didehydro-3-deoxy-L-rhamnonate hydrolase
MRLFRYGPQGKEKPGIADHSNVHWDISALGKDFDENFFESGAIHDLNEWLRDNQHQCKRLDKVERFGPAIVRPSKIVCIGLNFSDHAAESNAKVPAEPVVFFKSTTALCGPNDNVIIPRNSKKTDWEVELAVVIGKRASYVEEKDAMKYVAGFVLHNDYSEREFQLERSGQWVKGKSSDTFAPLGPYLVTPDEITDINNLRMWLDVNGRRMQEGNTHNMVFKVPFLISYISQFMTLLPGDIISTGTPAGVGLGLKPEPVYLKPGDVVELGIDGLGSSKQQLISYEESLASVK